MDKRIGHDIIAHDVFLVHVPGVPVAPPRLDDQVCFALYAASRAMTAAYRPMLDAMDLTYPQYLVMMVLWETDGLRVTELGGRLGMDMGTLSPLLKRMEARGVLDRRRRADDERVVQLWLTPEGKRLGGSAARMQAEALCRSDLTPRKIDALRASLVSLTKSLNEQTPTATTGHTP
jgi:DNA-binding MarR family transcriptional regulator